MASRLRLYILITNKKIPNKATNFKARVVQKGLFCLVMNSSILIQNSSTCCLDPPCLNDPGTRAVSEHCLSSHCLMPLAPGRCIQSWIQLMALQPFCLRQSALHLSRLFLPEFQGICLQVKMTLGLQDTQDPVSSNRGK